MDDESFEGHQNGRPRRHDGRDPWTFVTRDRVRAELARVTSADVSDAEPPEVRAGDVVVAIVERARNDDQGRHEEVWLEVESVDGDTLSVTFDSQPTWVRGVSAGDRTTLARACVLGVRRARGGA